MIIVNTRSSIDLHCNSFILYEYMNLSEKYEVDILHKCNSISSVHYQEAKLVSCQQQDTLGAGAIYKSHNYEFKINFQRCGNAVDKQMTFSPEGH